MYQPRKAPVPPSPGPTTPPLPVPPRHCRWILLEERCGPNEKMLDFTSTGPDGKAYQLCCDIVTRRATRPTPAMAARPATPTTPRSRLVPIPGTMWTPEYIAGVQSCGYYAYPCGTNPDGSVMCCEYTKPNPTLAATTRPATAADRRAHKRALWMGQTRSPVPRGACSPPCGPHQHCVAGSCISDIKDPWLAASVPTTRRGGGGFPMLPSMQDLLAPPDYGPCGYGKYQCGWWNDGTAMCCDM